MLNSRMSKTLNYLNYYKSSLCCINTWASTRDVAEYLGESIYIARRELLKLTNLGYIIRTEKSVGNSIRWRVI